MSKNLKDIILPDLGEGIDGAEVSEISVSTGDIVKEGDTIVVLESDKASMEIPSDFDGEIKSLGAWGGDFILATSDENPSTYFKAKGFETILPYSEMIL